MYIECYPDHWRLVTKQFYTKTEGVPEVLGEQRNKGKKLKGRREREPILGNGGTRTTGKES